MTLGIVHHILVWIHILLMVGAFGGLLFAHGGITGDLRRSEAVLRGGFRMASILIILGMLVGLFAFWFRIKIIAVTGEGSSGALLVAAKFVLWLVVAFCLMKGSMNAKQGDQDSAILLRWAAICLLAIAAFLGVLL